MDSSIVINREFGSGGREIGRMICERTGMELYDTRMLAEAAEINEKVGRHAPPA